MKAVFWIAAAVISYTYLAYPLGVYLLSRWRPHLWKRAEIYPTVSVIMAVHNGAALLRSKVEHILSLDYPPELIEIIVVSDGSSDDTAAILAGLPHPKVRPVICREQRGKAAAVNEGIRLAVGEILIFIDLRQLLAKDALHQLVSNFADPAVGCVTGELFLRPVDPKSITSAVGGLYWRYEQGIRLWEALSDSVLGVSGAFYAIRRELATELPEGLILDDMYQPLSVVRQGYRAVLDPKARFWDCLPEEAAGEFQRKVRTLAGNYQLLQMAPWVLSTRNRLRLRLISHKLLRLAVPPLLIVTLLASAMSWYSPFYLIMFLAQICFWMFAILGLLRIPILRGLTSPAAAFCLLNAAAVAAFLRFCFHRQPLWKIWASSTTGNPAAAGAPAERTELELPA